MIISYVGSMNDMYPIDGFLSAIKGIDIEFRIVGGLSDSQRVKLKGYNIIGYVDHKEAIDYMLSSDILLLIIPRHEKNEYIVTGKIYEYIASRKPILCVGPVWGDASLILQKCGHGRCFDYNDIAGMRNFVETIIE